MIEQSEKLNKSSNGIFFDGIYKSFGGTHALKGVSMNVERGEIVALLGENGAGKSTLIKVLGGIHDVSKGRVLIDGVEYIHKPGAINTAQKIAFIHQDLGLIEWMTIAENIAIATGYPRKFGKIDWAACEDLTKKALSEVDCDFDPTTRVSSLTRAEKSLVAIARALVVSCDFLVLDEPTASLPAGDVEKLFAVLRRLRKQGVGMIYVSHRLDEIFEVADRAVVLRDGKMVGVRDIAHTDPEELVGLIVGHKPKSHLKQALKGEKEVLTISDLKVNNVGPISFKTYAGEIVGLVGLRGAGQEDVGRCIFGDQKYDGSIQLEDEILSVKSPKQAIEKGIGLIARDRVVESLGSFLSIQENFFLNPGILGKKWSNLIKPKQEFAKAQAVGSLVGLSPNNPRLPIEALSGGNQQKVVVGRWIHADSKVLIAEDPTAGVDVGAKAEIYDLLNSVLEKGTAIIVISTDFEEVAEICQRAIVFSDGYIKTELSGINLTTEALIQAASVNDNL